MRDPSESAGYCRNCEATIYGDANYCQTCGIALSPDDARRDLVYRTIEFFPTWYVTLMSVIQSVALGYLLVSIKDRVATMVSAGSIDLIWIMLITITFGLIVLVWFDYMIGINTLLYLPKLPDAVIPFLLALTEGFMINSISFAWVSWWYFSFGATLIVAFLALFNMYRQARKHYERNKLVLELAGKTPALTEVTTLVIAALVISFGAAESVWTMNSIAFAAITLLVMLAWAVSRSFYWERLIETKAT